MHVSVCVCARLEWMPSETTKLKAHEMKICAKYKAKNDAIDIGDNNKDDNKKLQQQRRTTTARIVNINVF